MAGRLEGKIALIVGAGCVGPGWGNGRAACVLFAQEGAKIFAVDRDMAPMEETVARVKDAGGEIATHLCDVTQQASVAAMVKACKDKYGRIDVLVNNVGGSAPGGPVEMAEEAWDAQIDLNLKSAFLGCKYVLPVMERQGAGAVVNLSSVACLSHQVDGRTNVAYAASKAGVIAFTRSTAIAFVKKGIRVNCVVPGTMHTPLVEHRLARQLGANDAAALVAKRHASVPMGRMGDAWDIAHAVLFFASDEARYITATHLVVDGGLTAARPG